MNDDESIITKKFFDMSYMNILMFILSNSFFFFFFKNFLNFVSNNGKHY